MATGKKDLPPLNHAWSSTRNLGKNQLGGVIFGAKNTTIMECLSKQLFGLPSQHLVYVEKIDPGLPLFLLNYTDRTLHGIFEAASHGQKNIDPYAWTSDGSQRTPYPAQVQICVQLRCQPLTENQFKPVIVDNYYNQNHFWFELDHAQTNRLLSLFSTQVVSASHSTNLPVPFVPKKVENKLKEKDICSSYKTDQSLDDCFGTIGIDEKELVCMRLKQLALNHKFRDQPSTALEDETARIKVDPPSIACEDETARKWVDPASTAREDETNVVVKNDTALATNDIAQLIEKVEDLMAFKTEHNSKIACLEKKIISLEQSLAEAEKEIRNLKDHCIMLESMMAPSEECDTIKDNTSCSEFHLDNPPETSDIDIELCDDSIFLVGGYDGRSWFSSLDRYSPSLNLTKSLKPMNTARCYAPVSILNDELYVFGGGTGGVWYDTVESYDPVMNKWSVRPSLNSKKGCLAGATLNDKIYAAGGGNGDEFYSSVEMLDLDVGAWIPSRSMLQKRFSLAAAELNGALYVVGGYDGKSYLKSAERFDPREHSWTRIENMNTVRGCPCLVVLNEKLYVLGGFDSNAMVASVEIYDPRRGSWVMGDPMNCPRGFCAAAVVKESIYVFGGLKTGEEINHTVECYKEGQGWKTMNTRAGGRRCFFSAVAL